MIDTKNLRKLTQAALAGHDGVSLNWLKLLQDFQKAASPAAISELLDRLEAAEKERDSYKFAFIEYSEKTEWVQRGIDDGTVSAKYLGWHRADVMSDLLSAAEKERDNANQRYSSAVRLLAGIHALLYPPRLAGHDGRTWQFKSPLAEEQMQELSDRIRALPDEIARSALEEQE
jgi:hypothetical protein